MARAQGHGLPRHEGAVHRVQLVAFAVQHQARNRARRGADTRDVRRARIQEHQLQQQGQVSTSDATTSDTWAKKSTPPPLITPGVYEIRGGLEVEVEL